MGYKLRKEIGSSKLLLQAEASGAGAAVGERKFAVVDVSRGADRNVFVERRLLLIPSNTHTRALSEHEVELSAENASGASGSGLIELLEGCPLFSDNHLNDEVVLDAHAAWAIHVAKRLQADVAGGLKLYVNLALLKVGFPASLDLLAGDSANILVKDTLALTPDLGNVLGTGWSNELLRLLNTPVELAEPPSCL